MRYMMFIKHTEDYRGKPIPAGLIEAMGVPAAIFPGVVGVVTARIAYARTRVVPLADAPRRSLRVA